MGWALSLLGVNLGIMQVVIPISNIVMGIIELFWPIESLNLYHGRNISLQELTLDEATDQLEFWNEGQIYLSIFKISVGVL